MTSNYYLLKITRIIIIEKYGARHYTILGFFQIFPLLSWTIILLELYRCFKFPNSSLLSPFQLRFYVQLRSIRSFEKSSEQASPKEGSPFSQDFEAKKRAPSRRRPRQIEARKPSGTLNGVMRFANDDTALCVRKRVDLALSNKLTKDQDANRGGFKQQHASNEAAIFWESFRMSQTVSSCRITLLFCISLQLVPPALIAPVNDNFREDCKGIWKPDEVQ